MTTIMRTKTMAPIKTATNEKAVLAGATEELWTVSDEELVTVTDGVKDVLVRTSCTKFDVAAVDKDDVIDGSCDDNSNGDGELTLGDDLAMVNDELLIVLE